MFPNSQGTQKHWTDHISVGKMSLPVAYVFAAVSSIGLTFGLAELDNNSNVIGFIWIAAPAPLTIFVARWKRRRWTWWTAAAVTGVILNAGAVVLPFLSAMFLLTVLMAERSPIKVSEADLEAQENKHAMMDILAMRDETAVIHTAIEDRYMQRDFRAMEDQRAQLESFGKELERVPEQASPRGSRSRFHVMAGLARMEEVLDAAVQVRNIIAEYPHLAGIARGDDVKLKGKEVRQLQKQLGQIETNLDRARIQLAVSEGVLKALGYETPPPIIRPWVLPPEVGSSVTAVHEPAGSTRSRSRRPQRRSRF